MSTDSSRPGSGSKPSAGWQPPSLEAMQAMLPQYRFEKLLGRGGMGAVYKAVQTSLDRAVAIKVLPGDLNDDSDANFLERFKNEARTMAKMNHPSIVNVFDFGETQTGLLYIVMEFIDGTDVAQMILGQGKLPEDYALSITAHVCDALAYAHKNGVIHRDIKPANILINMEGAVKVADFGLAKQSDAGQSGLTKTNMAMGTPDFVAPEALIPGMPLDGRADLYAIGVMLYQMLTGEIPRGMWTMPGMKLGTDPRFDAIIGKAMQTDREARYQSAADIRRDLDTILTTPRALLQSQAPAAPAQPAQKPAAQAPRSPQSPKAAEKPQAAAPPAAKKSRAGLYAGLGAAAAVLAGGWLFFGAGGEKPKKPASPPAANSAAKPATTAPIAETQPNSAPPTRNALQTLDLLALIDPVKDRVTAANFTAKNTWKREGNKLVYESDGKAGKVAAPVSLANCRDYELELKASKRSGTDRIHVDVPLTNGRILPLVLNSHGRKVLNEKQGSDWGPASSSVHVKIRVVRGAGGSDRIVIQRQGSAARQLADWSGDLDTLGKAGERHPDFRQETLPSIFSMKDTYEVETFRLRVFEGEAKELRGGKNEPPVVTARAEPASLNALWQGWTGPRDTPLTAKWKANGAEVSTNERTTLWSPGKHGNFELELEWKVGPGGNGGVFYHVQGDNELAAFEMQLSDPANSGSTRSGGLYGVQKESRDAAKPVGQWNLAKLVVNGTKREHWINGELVCSYDVSDADFRTKVSSSKLPLKPSLDASEGRIVLQANAGEVMYRGVKIQPLAASASSSGAPAMTPPVAATPTAQVPPPAMPPPSTPPAVANDPVRAKLADLEAKFQSAFERDAGAAYKAQIATLNTGYTAALDRELAAATKAGKLDDAVVLREEKQRITEGKGLPPEDLDSLPEALKRLRGTWRSTESGYARQRDAKGAPLFDAYDRMLDAYQKELTQQNKIDDALRVKTAREELVKRRGTVESPAAETPATATTPKTTTPVPAGQESSSSWRKAAEWVLGVGGNLRIHRNGSGDTTVKDAKDLPSGRFDIRGMILEPRNGAGKQVTDDDLTRFNGMRDIDSFQCSHLTSVTGSGFAAFAASAETMSKFIIYDSPIDPRHLPLIAQFKNLRLIELNRIETLPAESLAFIQSFKELTQLRLLGQMKLDDKTLLQFAGLTKLTDLTLPGAQITDDGLAALKGMKELTSVDLSGIKGITGRGLAHLAGASELTRLMLGHTPVEAAALAHLSGCSKLRHIGLNQTAITDDCMRHLGMLKSLSTLEIGAKGITGATLHQLANCKELTRLELYERSGPDKSSVDDAGLQALAAAGLPNLIDLSFAKGSTTEAGLAHLTGMKLKTLRTNEAPSLQGLQQIAKIGTLEYLEIERGELGDDGLAVIASLKSLHTFSSSASKITDAGLKVLQNMPALKTLILRNSQASEAGLDALKKARPDLKVNQ